MEGNNTVSLPKGECQLDCFEITKSHESLIRRTKFGLKSGPSEATPERRSVRRTRPAEEDDGGS